ncbi:MAG: hypothetical protein LBQ79_13600 [Deltaproteobacteria bacterium]|jgi:hypothetical protein|nr:hypothetical protein [Deltaproteobacteria bacterium]
MQKSILDWKTRRAILESRRAPEPAELTRAGRELLDAGRPAEAWEFFRRSGDRTALEDLRQAAVAEGDFFVYSLAAGVLDLEPDPAVLGRLAETARSMGKEISAAKAEAAADGLSPKPGAGGGESGGPRGGGSRPDGEELTG